MKYLINFIILFSFNILLTNNIYSQCCSAGNPNTSNNNSSNLNKGDFQIQGNFKHNYSNKYYNGSNVSDFNYINYSLYDFSYIQLKYAISNKFRVNCMSGYFINKKQVFNKPIYYERNAKGFGDFVIGFDYNLINIKKNNLNITPEIKVTVPTGKFDLIINNILLPIDVQPSAGNYRFMGAINFNKKFTYDSKFSFSGKFSYEISNKIESERVKSYKYGSVINTNLNSNYIINKKISIGLGINEQFRYKSIDKGNTIYASGGHTISLLPSINYGINDKININSTFEYFIYRIIDGPQLSSNYGFQISISKIINTKNSKNE